VLSAAKIAADAITDAFRGAAGDPNNPRWILAFARLSEFLEACPPSTSPALVALQRFLDENLGPSEQEDGAVVLARQLQLDC